MKNSVYAYVAILLTISGCYPTKSVKSSPQVIFRGQTEDEAFSHVMQVIKDLPYYKKHGYKVVLPEHEAFKKIYENQNDNLSIDKNYIKKIFTTEIYDKSLFEQPLKTIRKTTEDVNKALQKLAQLKKNWGFVLKPKYEIILAAYGNDGGIYQWWFDSGKIWLRSDKIFKKNIIETTYAIIHDIVHIGIEKVIVQKYKLNQWQKERVVDLICLLYLKDILPYYSPPNLNKKHGDRRIDEFVDKEAILQNLPSAIEKFKANQ